ncbi:hypothetical protein RI367_001374 [Sorochytrium milnesiophthora]
MVETVNDGQLFIGLVTDSKFMAYLFATAVTAYVTHFYRRSYFLWAAAASAGFGVIGTLLVTVHNELQRKGELTYAKYLAVLVPIEITWGCSEYFCAITTWFKLQQVVTERYQRRSRVLLVINTLAFAVVRLVILVVRIRERTIWDYNVYLAHMVYYLVLSVIDIAFTYNLISISRKFKRTHPFTSLRGFMTYTVFGAYSRVLFYDGIMLVIAVTYLGQQQGANLTVQNFCFSLKYSFSVVFTIDFMLSENLLQSARALAQQQQRGGGAAPLVEVPPAAVRRSRPRLRVRWPPDQSHTSATLPQPVTTIDNTAPDVPTIALVLRRDMHSGQPFGRL